MRTRINTRTLQKLQLDCLNGLTIDGSQHKQYFLDLLLQQLCALLKEDYLELKEKYEFDAGIAP